MKPPAREEPPSGVLRVGSDRTAAGAMIELLCAHGVDTFFGVPGGPVIPVFDAILKHASATLIEPRHETNGAFAAMGFHRATGRTPGVVVTAGPGATNVVTGVTAAHFERVPMIVICGDVPWASTGKRLLQDTGEQGVGIERMLQGVTRACIRVSHADAALGQMRAAIEAAHDPENPGPVLVVISVDWAGSLARGMTLHGPAPERRLAPPRAPDAGLVRDVLRRVDDAERPLLVLGGGCRTSQRDVAELVDALGIPFVTTPRAKGLVSELHPLSLRSSGMGSSWWARRYMRGGVDLALVLGTDLDDVSLTSTPLLRDGGALIHVDTDASVFGRNYPTAVAAVCDVGAVARALVDRAGPPDRPRVMALLAEARSASPFDVPDFRDDESVPVAPHRVIADLERAAGSGATLVTDIGEHMLFALHYATAAGPDGFVIHLGLGSMASGISSAVGLALGRRDRRVVCVCGDGGMHMAGSELLVAVRERLPIVYAVFNDSRYNMVYHGYRLTFGGQAEWRTPMVDFAAWARSFGARGAIIERPGEITAELLDELTRDGLPAVLDIRHDADVRIKGDGRIEAIRQMSLMHSES